MRPLAFASALAIAFAGGLPPRPNPSDYPVHQSAANATIAALRVPTREVEKMFSPDIARQYVVIEVAIYPQSNFDVDWFDFNLKIGNNIAHVEKPRDVATPWPEKTVDPKGPTVYSETGVLIQHTSDPVYGRRTSVGTYEGATVTNAPPPPPPPRQGPDPQLIEQRVRERSLPEGITHAPIAGYLFFPHYKSKDRNLELRWSKASDSATLRIP